MCFTSSSFHYFKPPLYHLTNQGHLFPTTFSFQRQISFAFSFFILNKKWFTFGSESKHVPIAHYSMLMSSRWPSSLSTRRHFHTMTVLCHYCQATSFTCQTGLIMAARSKCSFLFLWLRLCTLWLMPDTTCVLTDSSSRLCPTTLLPCSPATLEKPSRMRWRWRE